jgi:type VII secretion integral membrane protein EccD
VAIATRSGLCRVTVVAPRSRTDVALPEDVPLADLAPALLRYAGEDLADEGAAHGGWVFSKVGSGPLDSSRTAAQTGLKDGDQLFLTPRSKAAPPATFDDIIDAVATGTQNRGGRWVASTSRNFAVGLAVLTMLAVGLLFVLTGPPRLPSAVGALGLALALVVTGGILSRAAGDSQAGALLGVLALVHAAVGGLLVLAFDRELGELGAPDALVASGAVFLVAVLAALLIADQVPVFLAAAIGAATFALATVLALGTGIGGAGSAAIVVSLALASTSMLPMLSFRLARLPMPSVPTGPEDLRTDTEQVDGERVLRQSDDAARYLTGLLLVTGVIVLVSELYLATGGSVMAWTLCAVVALTSAVRARIFIGRLQRLPLLVAGVFGVAILALGAILAGGLVERLAGAGVLVLVAAVFLVYGLALAGRRPSPVWGRILDIVEILMIVAIVPLALAVCGGYEWVRGLNG